MPMKEPLTSIDENLLVEQIQRLEPALQIDFKMYLKRGLFVQAYDLLKKEREHSKNQLLGIKELLKFMEEKVIL